MEENKDLGGMPKEKAVKLPGTGPGGASVPLRATLALLCLVLGILSATVGAARFSDPERYGGTIASLDKKRSDVLELTAAATATSVLITAVPGDTATPIADKFADMTQWFLLVLCAISLEKYLVTVTGAIAFRFLIPFGLLLLLLAAVFWKRSLCKSGIKILVFALIIFLLIPTSTQVSAMIERTYSYSVDGTLESADSVHEDLEGLTGGSSGETGSGNESGDESPEGIEEAQGNGSFIDFITGIPSGLADAAGSAASTLSGIVQFPGQLVEKLQTLLNQFIESLAYMLITSCAIPLLVLIFFITLIRFVFGGLFGGGGRYTG